jgi:hypothetical protein
MMRAIFATVSGFVLLWCAMAHADDAIKTKLDAAKATYDSAMEKFRGSACDWFDRAERDAREKGSKQRVDKILVERQAFEERDELPETAPAALKRTHRTVQAEMESAYRRAIADYTKVKQDGEATAIEKELEHFKKNDFSDKLDRLQAGTVWEGNGAGVSDAKPGRNDFRATFTILERDEGRFKARFESATVRRIVNGHIKGRRIWWSKEDVTVEKGPNRGADQFGYVNDKQIRMRIQGKTDDGVAHLGLVEYRLIESK